MEKNLQADSGLCLPHWLQRPRTNRLQLLLSCGMGKRFADRRNRQRQVGGRTGLAGRKPGAWCFEALEESLCARVSSGILREKWTSCSFPCSSVWAEDAEYGIGRVDWERLLCANTNGNGPGRGAMGKAADREPHGVLDNQEAPREEQPQSPQGCCSGGGDDHGPLCGSNHPVDGEKILQALGQEIGDTGATENGSGVDSVGDKNSCFAVSCHEVFHADLCCSGCCLADAISCFGLPVQEGVDFQTVDATQSDGPSVEAESESEFLIGPSGLPNWGYSLEAQLAGDLQLHCSEHELAPSPVQTTDSAPQLEQEKRTCQDVGQDMVTRQEWERDCCPGLSVCHFDLEHGCLVGSTCLIEIEQGGGLSYQSEVHEDDLTSLVQGSCQEACQTRSTGQRNFEHSGEQLCSFAGFHGECNRTGAEEGRPVPVICHCDLEHDQSEWDTGHVQPIQGVDLPCHRVSYAGALESVNKLPEGCQTHGTSHFDHGHGEDSKACSEPIGAGLVVSTHCALGVRPFPHFEQVTLCKEPRHCCSPQTPFEFRTFDPCEPVVGECQFSGTCRSGPVQSKHVDRSEQVSCHFDLEHDGHDCCKFLFGITQEVETLCHRATYADTGGGLVPCIFQQDGQSQVTSHFDLEHENEPSTFVDGARGDWAQTGAEDYPGSQTDVQVYPTPSTLEFRPLPQCVKRVQYRAPRWAYTPSIPVGFRPLDPSGSHVPLPGAQVTEIVPGSSDDYASRGRHKLQQADAEVGAAGRELQQLAEPRVIDCTGCDFLGGPLFSLVSCGIELTSYFDLEHQNEPSSFVAGARGDCAQTGAEDCPGTQTRFQVCPTPRT